MSATDDMLKEVVTLLVSPETVKKHIPSQEPPIIKKGEESIVLCTLNDDMIRFFTLFRICSERIYQAKRAKLESEKQHLVSQLNKQDMTTEESISDVIRTYYLFLGSVKFDLEPEELLFERFIVRLFPKELRTFLVEHAYFRHNDLGLGNVEYDVFKGYQVAVTKVIDPD